jgi:hypothetical protein
VLTVFFRLTENVVDIVRDGETELVHKSAPEGRQLESPHLFPFDACVCKQITAQHSTAQRSTAQRSTAQRSAAQRSTAQHDSNDEPGLTGVITFPPTMQA